MKTEERPEAILDIRLVICRQSCGVGLIARIASESMTLERPLNIKLIPIRVPIIHGESGGHFVTIKMPSMSVPMPSTETQTECCRRLMQK